jgi:hypothetical protein
MPISLAELEAAVRASWAADTCSPDDAATVPWSADNPSWGHCDVTALVLNDVLGGDLMVAEVHVDGERYGYHWWNRLASGVEIDLTRDQFRNGQVISPPRALRRPEEPPRRRNDEYLRLRRRVIGKLGPLPGSVSPHDDGR